jgi:hypothetical protein
MSFEAHPNKQGSRLLWMFLINSVTRLKSGNRKQQLRMKEKRSFIIFFRLGGVHTIRTSFNRLLRNNNNNMRARAIIYLKKSGGNSAQHSAFFFPLCQFYTASEK